MALSWQSPSLRAHGRCAERRAVLRRPRRKPRGGHCGNDAERILVWSCVGAVEKLSTSTRHFSSLNQSPRPNVASNKRFSPSALSTIGAGTVLMLVGGARQPAASMVAKLPVMETNTVSSWPRAQPLPHEVDQFVAPTSLPALSARLLYTHLPGYFEARSEVWHRWASQPRLFSAR